MAPLLVRDDLVIPETIQIISNNEILPIPLFIPGDDFPGPIPEEMVPVMAFVANRVDELGLYNEFVEAITVRSEDLMDERELHRVVTARLMPLIHTIIMRGGGIEYLYTIINARVTLLHIATWIVYAR